MCCSYSAILVISLTVNYPKLKENQDEYFLCFAPIQLYLLLYYHNYSKLKEAQNEYLLLSRVCSYEVGLVIMCLRFKSSEAVA